MKPTIILVGADKGGVGKTTISRALIDFMTRHTIPVRVFDTEVPRGSLQRFYPDISEIIDLNSVEGQISLLDNLDTADADVTVVDFKAGNLSSALAVFEKIGVLKAARDGKFNLGLVHVVGPSVSSLEEISEIADYIEGLDYVLARNFINETNFFEWDTKTHKKYFGGMKRSSEITVPKLNEMAYEQVDLAGVTFNNFLENKTADQQPAGYSFVLRGYVNKWTTDLEKEFQRLHLIKTIVAGIKEDVAGASSYQVPAPEAGHAAAE